LELRVIGILDCFAPTSEYHQSQINGCNYLIFVFGVLERRQIATVASLPRDEGVAEGIVYGGLEAHQGRCVMMEAVLPISPYGCLISAALLKTIGFPSHCLKFSFPG
jgi:hypothetical protein